MLVKLKSNGRIGFVGTVEGDYRTVFFKPQGKECTRTKANAIIQKIRHDNLEEIKES